MSEKIIYALSTLENISIDKFNEIYRELYFPVDPDAEDLFFMDTRQYLIRLLDSLGYCEFDFDRRTIYMCPPRLVSLPSFGLPKAVLTGARSPRLIKNIKAISKKTRGSALFTFMRQKNRYVNIPPSVYIEASSADVLNNIARELKISFDYNQPASWKLANFSCSVNDIKNSLLFEKRKEPNWDTRVFMKRKLHFSKNGQNEGAGFVLKEYRNPKDKQFRHWLWDGKSAAEVNRDWGRYLSLASSDSNIMVYDKEQFKMGVPLTVPAPCLLSRALVMCSGAVPEIRKTPYEWIGCIPPSTLMHIYSGVIPEIADLVSQKLGQTLISISFKK